VHYSAPPFVTLLRDAMGSQISVLKNAGWKSNRTAAECSEELNLAAKSQVKKALHYPHVPEGTVRDGARFKYKLMGVMVYF
jgi:hypothetical protein